MQQTAPPAGLEGPPGPHPWVPPAPGRRTRTALFVVGGVFTVLALLAGAAVVLSALTGDSPTASPGSAPVTAPTQVQAIGEWYRGGGRQILGDLAQDFQNAGTATSPETLRAACTGLRGHVAAAQAYTPIPDAEAHRHFAAALDRYEVGASDCLAGISGESPQLIDKAGQELAAGTRSMSESTQRIASLASGRPI